MLPELFVLRHGETAWNREGRWQGALDSPLTDKGVAQARAMGALLAARGVGPKTHQILCSPQGRAQATADLAFGAGCALTEPRLREIGVGAFAGLTQAEIMARAGLAEDAPFLDCYAAAPGGEPFDALFERVADCLAALRQPTIIVTHGITSRFLRTAAMGWGLDRILELPGGQGVVHRLFEGEHETLFTEGVVPERKPR